MARAQSQPSSSFIPVNSHVILDHSRAKDGLASSVTTASTQQSSTLKSPTALPRDTQLSSGHHQSPTSDSLVKPNPTNSRSKFRDVILAASESICARLPKKRNTSGDPPAGQPMRKRKPTGHAKKDTFKIAEDLLDDQATLIRPSSHTKDILVCMANAEESMSSTWLSEKSQRKLNSFKYKPKHNSLTHSPVPFSDVEPLIQKQTSIHSTNNYREDQEDEFDIDDQIFYQIVDNDEGDHSSVPEETFTQSFYSDPFSSLNSADEQDTQQTPCESLLALTEPVTPAKPPTDPIAHSEAKPASVIPCPFLRAKASSPVPPQNSILGLSPEHRIITCFRIAEVLRTVSSYKPNSTTLVTIELFAAVAASHRDYHMQKQHFVLADLFFPQRPPYLHGVYSLWHGVDLFETDSAAFLDNTANAETRKLCRAIIRIDKKEWNIRTGRGRSANLGSSPQSGVGGCSPETRSSRSSTANPGRCTAAITRSNTEAEPSLEVTILSIWEADWDDVEYTRGIVHGT